VLSGLDRFSAAVYSSLNIDMVRDLINGMYYVRIGVLLVLLLNSAAH